MQPDRLFNRDMFVPLRGLQYLASDNSMFFDAYVCGRSFREVYAMAYRCYRFDTSDWSETPLKRDLAQAWMDACEAADLIAASTALSALIARSLGEMSDKLEYRGKGYYRNLMRIKRANVNRTH